MATEVCVVVPGIMGSELYDGTELVWPGSPAELLLPYRHMTQLMMPVLKVGDVIRSFSISDQYSVLLGALERCGFHGKGSPPTLYVCPYDWRRDNSEAAERLKASIESIFTKFPGGVEINLIAHSMGGLVSRYYLESGLFTTAKGYGSVRRLITLATPHRGAPLALSAAVGHEKRLFLNAQQVKQIADDSHFPALYQLLPPMHEPFAWNQDPAARFAPVDIYDAGTGTQLGLSQDNLKATRGFHRFLDVSKRPANVDYFCFVGTQQTTQAEARVTLSSGTTRAAVVTIERDDGGDGTVPSWSAGLTGIQSAAVGGEHGEIYKNAGLQQVLATILGKSGVLGRTLPRAALSVRNPVVEPGDETRAVLSFDTPTNLIEGELRTIRLVDTTGTHLATPARGAALKVNYSGAPVDRLSIQLVAPDIPGGYRIEFVPDGEPDAIAADELLVQRPGT